MSASPIPVLSTGIGETIGRQAIMGLKPEIEVIQFALRDTINTELPLLLKGEVPAEPSSTIGSGNWATPPQALIFGGGYSDEDIEEVQKLIEQTPGVRRIPWIRVDKTKTVGAPGTREYAMGITKRIKDLLAKLSDEGKLGDGQGGLYSA